MNTFQCARYCVEAGHKILISPISHRPGRDHQSRPMGLASQGRRGKVAISVAPPRISSSTSGGPEATSGGPDSGTQTISRCYRPPLPVISGGPAISEAFNFSLLACATRPKSDPRTSHNIVQSQYVTNLFSAESRPRASLQLFSKRRSSWGWQRRQRRLGVLDLSLSSPSGSPQRPAQRLPEAPRSRSPSAASRAAGRASASAGRGPRQRSAA